MCEIVRNWYLIKNNAGFTGVLFHRIPTNTHTNWVPHGIHLYKKLQKNPTHHPVL